MSTRSPEQILADLAGILRNFNGREYSGPIGPQTLFFGDLGLVSIDAIVLAETLEQHYGKKLPFNEFLAAVGREGVRDIEVGELVHFLHQQLYPCRT
jgi:acyl carrier protein